MKGYRGYWKEGNRRGKGTEICPNGDQYKGKWENNKKEGYGVLIDRDEKILKNGTWRSGIFIKAKKVK
ncbi:hypothetical protein AGMMS49949_06380 [Alphaproteobacteria bacterium]|nr:hypothetical protein AGMMS49949_06380 [Alphaproteobacteria bacterium]GHS97912.1 hypothetical protein AGMMS50296_5220 [Alphaproteobacteria bacterium]